MKVLALLLLLAGQVFAAEPVIDCVTVRTRSPENPTVKVWYRVLRNYDVNGKGLSRVLILFGGRNCDGRPEVSGKLGWTEWADLNGIFLVAPTLKDDNYWEPEKWSGRAVRDANGETTEDHRSYDKYGRLVEKASFGTSVTYRYDAKGRIARQTVDGSPIDFTYTTYGRLAGKYLGGREKPDASVEYEYSPAGKIVARTANGIRQTYEHDGRGQLLAVKEGDTDVERYAYDKAGNILRKSLLRPAALEEFRTGRACRPATAADYTTTTFTFDGANQLVSSITDGITTRYAYDAAGRLVKEGNRTYRYGYLDKILSVTDGTKTYTYDYHVDGQLARSDYGKADGNDGRAGSPLPAGTEDFIWDGLALIKRGVERFVNEPHIGGGNPVASSKGTTYFNDMLGTTVGTKHGRNGNLTWERMPNEKVRNGDILYVWKKIE